jgi:hypothetical protein
VVTTLARHTNALCASHPNKVRPGRVTVNVTSKWGCAEIHRQVLIDLECCAHKPGERTRTETETRKRNELSERLSRCQTANASESINPTPPHLPLSHPSSPSPLHPPPTILHRYSMSVSIDDLVSSFSASHVSQEAMDIATLQVIS